MKIITNILKTLFLLLIFFGASSFAIVDPDDAIADNSQVIIESQLEQANKYKTQSIKYTKEGKTALAVENIKNYILATGDFSILENSAYGGGNNDDGGTYEGIYENEGFIALKAEYQPNFTMSKFFYLYIGLIGIFIAFVLNVRRRTDRVANGLIGLFVLMHSFFLIHTTLYTSNYTLNFPHTLNMSTFLSFMYGPVLYFYFKRITENYTFKKSDLIHLGGF